MILSSTGEQVGLIKMASTAVLFPCGISAQEVKSEPQRNSHTVRVSAGDKPWKPAEAEMKTTFKNFLSVFSSISDLIPLVASAPGGN